MNKIVIIDTGVDINSTYIRKYVKDIVGIKVKKNGETFDVVSTSTDPTCINDTVGHGTAITGIILSHNPNVSIFFVKIFEAGELVADEDTLIEPGVRTFSWTGYATIPRLCRYSQGLIFPSDVLIRFVLYHSRYLLRISMNSDILTPVQS